MMVVYGGTPRREIRLSPKPLHEGGEVSIYSVQGQLDWLVKIYKPDKRTGKEEKLAWMIRNPPIDPNQSKGHSSFAWPRNKLYDAKHQFAGFLMLHIQDAVPIVDIFNPKKRKQILPDFDIVYLHRTAFNLAKTIRALHDRDYVVGDLNQRNILVKPDTRVSIIDTDSFQVLEHRQSQIIVYRCEVITPEYTPPELQEKDMRDVLRKAEHDCFALGVLIFQLLMEGNHPFRSSWLGENDPPPMPEKIRQGWFPYVTSPAGPIAPPPNVSLERLHSKVADLIYRCFVDGHLNPRLRPTPKEWESVLEEAEREPERENRYSVSRIQEIARQDTSVLKSPQPLGKTEAIVPVHLSASCIVERCIIGGYIFVAILLFYFAWNSLLTLEAMILGISGGFVVTSLVFVFRFRSLPEVSKKLKMQSNLRYLQQQEIKPIKTFIQRCTGDRIKLAEECRQKEGEITSRQRKLAQSEAEEIAKVDRRLEEILRNTNLQRRSMDQAEASERERVFQLEIRERLAQYNIEDASVHGVGQELKKSLVFAGIRTAADIVGVHISSAGWGRYSREVAYIDTGQRRIHIDGIGPAKAQALLSWRQGIESHIRKGIALPYAQQVAISSKYQTQHQQLIAQEINAKQDVTKEKDSIRLKYKGEQDALTRQLQDVRNEFTRKRRNLEQEVSDAEKRLAEKYRALSEVQRELDAYREIRFAMYLTRIIFLQHVI